MIRRAAIFALLVLLTVSARTVGAMDGNSGSCDGLLQAAEAAQKLGEGEKAVELFEHAFRVCPKAESLPVEGGARLANLRGRFLFVERKDAAAAIEVYDEALAWTASKVGLNHPARIDLLEGLAFVIENQAVQEDVPEEAAAGLERARHLYHEALKIRESAYGARSLEAVEGWLLLSAAYLNDHPIIAEAHARRGYEIVEEVAGPYAPSVLDALSMMMAALEKQGKAREAAELRERYVTVETKLRQAGKTLDDR